MAQKRGCDLRHIFITGDITDSGRVSEWGEFLDILGEYPQLKSRTLFVPGNHDLNIPDRNNPARTDMAFSWTRAMRQIRALKAMCEVQGDRVFTVNDDGSAGATLEAFLKTIDVATVLDAYTSCSPDAGEMSIGQVWEKVFPLSVFPTDDQKYGVVLLDSNAEASFSFTNALGSISELQAKKFRNLIAMHKDYTWIVLLHHHVTEVGLGQASTTERLGTILTNPNKILTPLINATHSTSIILHGHRHVEWFGASGERNKVTVISAASSCLGGAYDRISEPVVNCFE